MAYLRKVIEVNPSDYNCVAPGRHMKGNVVDAYLRILERRSLCSDALPLVFAFDHLFFSLWDNTGYSAIQEITQGHDIFAKDLLLFPSPINNHWTVILVDIRKRHIHCFDPLGKPHYSRMEKVLDFLFAEAKVKKITFSRDAWLCFWQPENCPKLSNEADSGVYICVFSEKLTRDKSLFRHCPDVLAGCKAIAQALRRQKIDQEDFSLHESPLFERFGIVYPKFSLQDISVQQQADPKIKLKKNHSKKFFRKLVPEVTVQPTVLSSSPELPEDAIQFIHAVSHSDSLESDNKTSVQKENLERKEVPISIIEGLPSAAVKHKSEAKQQVFGVNENGERKKRKIETTVASRNNEERSEEKTEVPRLFIRIPISIIEGLSSGSTAVKRKSDSKQQVLGVNENGERKKRNIETRVASRNTEERSEENTESLQTLSVCQTLKAQISIIPQGRTIDSETTSGSVNDWSLLRQFRLAAEGAFMVRDPQ